MPGTAAFWQLLLDIRMSRKQGWEGTAVRTLLRSAPSPLSGASSPSPGHAPQPWSPSWGHQSPRGQEQGITVPSPVSFSDRSHVFPCSGFLRLNTHQPFNSFQVVGLGDLQLPGVDRWVIPWPRRYNERFGRHPGCCSHGFGVQGWEAPKLVIPQCFSSEGDVFSLLGRCTEHLKHAQMPQFKLAVRGRSGSWHSSAPGRAGPRIPSSRP